MLADRSFSEAGPRIVRPGDAHLRDIRSALVVVAHPDDLEGHCGGSVALLTETGCSVHLVLCTSGEKGTADRKISASELGQLREDEQRAAAHRLGIASLAFLRYPDGEVPNDRDLRRQIVFQIRLRKPDLVITHDPEYPWPAYTAHRDHRATGRATLDAVYPDARDHLFFPEQLHTDGGDGVEPHIAPEAWLIMSRIPDLYVDIATTTDRKIAARLEHRSQLSDSEALDRSFRARSAEIGSAVGLSAAEAFKVVRFA